MRKMRILLVTPGMHSPWVDGRITALKTLAEALARKGAEVQVLTTETGRGEEQAYRANGVSYLVLPGGSRRNWVKLLRRFGEVCDQKVCDVAIYRPFAGFNWLNLASIFALRWVALLKGIPFVLSPWGGPAEVLSIPWVFSGVLVASGLARSRTYLIPPVVEMKEVERESAEGPPLKRFGISAGERVCLFTYCARASTPSLWKYILEQRGLRDVLRAAEALKDLPSLKFLISMPVLAEESGRERFAELAGAEGVRGNFVLAGEIADLEAVLAAVDLYLYPLNLDEPSWAPVSVLEAFACGTPVITTRTRSILQFVSEDEALLYQPGRFEELAAEIRRLLADPPMAHELARRARERVSACHSADKVAEQTLEVLYKITSRNHPLPAA